MTTLTADQVAALALGAGLAPDKAIIAVAVAKPESGWRTEAFNGNGGTGDLSYGLWQINMIGTLGPARRQQFGITTNEQLFDPQTNAKAMAIVSGGGSNWSPWTGYKSGAYHAYLAEATAAVNRVSSGTGGGGGLPIPSPGDIAGGIGDVLGSLPNPLDAASGLADVLKSVGEFFAKLLQPEFWKRLGVGVVGAVLIIGGVVVLNRDLIKTGITDAAVAAAA